MPVSLGRLVRLICRTQAAALVGLSVALLVLAANSTLTLAPGFLAVDVVGALLVAAVLGYGSTRPRLRTAVLLVELIALPVAYGLLTSNRVGLALLVGVPALATVVLLIAAVAKLDRRGH